MNAHDAYQEGWESWLRDGLSGCNPFQWWNGPEQVILMASWEQGYADASLELPITSQLP